MPPFSKLYIILAAATGVCANLSVNNWCKETVYMYQSNSQKNALACNQGADGICATKPVTKPYEVKPGEKNHVIRWIKNGQGTSIKIAKDTKFDHILQFEYTADLNTLFWDLSNLDGAGASISGTPFEHDNVKASPSGEGVGSGTCHDIKCAANKLCTAAYQHPDDTATKACPAKTGTMTLDLCLPEAKFNTRAVAFKA